MATYKQIAAAVRESADFEPETCWIAHVKSDYGLTRRQAPNRIDPDRRCRPCPPSKRSHIEGVLRDFGMI